MNFTKMHGLGNDYIYVNTFDEKVENPAELAKVVSDRHFGIGGDGLILIAPSEKADAKMRIFNADGSEAEMCGNGLRCVAKYVFDHKLAEPGDPFPVPDQQTCPYSLKIETGNGVLRVGIIPGDDGKAALVCVNMGQPILAPRQIPVDLDGENVIDRLLQLQGQDLRMTCVSMGNPHAVFFSNNIDSLYLEKIGPLIENHSLFPNRINAHFVEVVAPDKFKMRTWERGSGITLACGTGACACAVAVALTDRGKRITTAHLPGGDLNLNWSSEDNCVYMTGPATEVFTGTWPSKS